MGECYCLNDVEQLRLTNDTECSSPCFRQNLLPCDGVEESYSVYSTGLGINTIIIIIIIKSFVLTFISAALMA